MPIFNISSVTTHCSSRLNTIRVRSINIISLCIVKVGFICSEKPSSHFYVPAMKSCRLPNNVTRVGNSPHGHTRIMNSV